MYYITDIHLPAKNAHSYPVSRLRCQQRHAILRRMFTCSSQKSDHVATTTMLNGA